ncbi:hypothetical protein IBX73_07545 [candidate division WOR-3 bacterium]|nr:hypothetical protein [candidate division WOR-3 bacterium]
MVKPIADPVVGPVGAQQELVLLAFAAVSADIASQFSHVGDFGKIVLIFRPFILQMSIGHCRDRPAQ